MFDGAVDLIQDFDSRTDELSEDECCMEFSNDERYQDYACRSHIRLVQARLSYTEIFAPSCKRTDTIQQDWYLPSVFHAAETDYPEIDDLDTAIREGLVAIE